MFESDDFDHVLSQFDFPEIPCVKPNEKENLDERHHINKIILPQLQIPALISKRNEGTSEFTTKNVLAESIKNKTQEEIPGHEIVDLVKDKIQSKDTFISPKHTKRKIINSYFNHQSKRKFPGPAGLLTGTLEEPKDESLCEIELLSQDIDCTQHNFKNYLFELPLWIRLQSDTKSWQLPDVDSIKRIKQQALTGNLRKRKAQAVTAFIEAVDRSATDPLIILRDSTGSIKCTLHRDAWSKFSPYIMSEYCALILQNPTVLTTGGAYKKHYLNITLSNILALYSSAVLIDDDKKFLPDGYNILYQEDFTVIKTEKCSDNIGTLIEEISGTEDLLDGLENFFTDDMF